jgi:catechol 2,3-dioxygenase-like lactoylglutathione lyase family enzyme
MRDSLGSTPSALVDLNQVTAPCADLEASVAFYRQLGLRLIVNDPPDYARFECPVGEATFSLHRVPIGSNDHGIVVYFEIENLDARVRQLIAAGLQFESGPQDQPWLWREAYLQDPGGNRICLYHAGKNRKNPPWRLPDPS